MLQSVEHGGLVVICCTGSKAGKVGQGWQQRESAPCPVAWKSCRCRGFSTGLAPWASGGSFAVIMFEMASLLLVLQNMLLEIEEKVTALSELSMHSENLLLETDRTETRQEAEQLARKLRTLKGGLLELQRMLQDKQTDIQVRGFTLWKLTNVMMNFLNVQDSTWCWVQFTVGTWKYREKHFSTSHMHFLANGTITRLALLCSIEHD